MWVLLPRWLPRWLLLLLHGLPRSLLLLPAGGLGAAEGAAAVKLVRTRVAQSLRYSAVRIDSQSCDNFTSLSCCTTLRFAFYLQNWANIP